MEMEWSESRYEPKQESRFENASPDEVYKEEKENDFEDAANILADADRSHDNGENLATKDKEKSRDLGKHRSKDRKKERKDEKGHGSKDREKSKTDLTKGREENKNEDREKDHMGSRERVKTREKDYDRDRHRDKDHGKEKDKEKEHDRTRDRGKDRDRERELEERSQEREYKRGRERDRDRERDREKEHDRNRGRERDRDKELLKDREREKDRDRDREREKDRDRAKEREREKERVKDREREREKDKDRDRVERDKGKGKTREKEKEKDKERNLEDSDKEKTIGKNRDRGYDKEVVRGKDEERDEKLKSDYEDARDIAMQVKEDKNRENDSHEMLSTKDHKQRTESLSDESQISASELEQRIMRMKEERLKKKSDGAYEVLAWVNKSRKLEEKLNAEKEKALHQSKVFEEQDIIDQGESDEELPQHPTNDLAGVKIVHGLEKVLEGGAVVLTLKDQNILADGDINEEADMLENVEIGEQKRRNEAYKAAKIKTGIYDDKFNDDPGSQKKILPQYDDPMEEEGVTLDGSGRFSGEAEKKLEELRRRIQGASAGNKFEDLTSTGKISSDYYTHEEMIQFKKPKKKKSLRKREKLDLDALEAEAIATGLGTGDLGSRNEERRQSVKAEQEKAEAETRNKAYQAAYEKAEEASKALRHEQTLTIQAEEDENLVFGRDDEDLYKSLEKARKLALKKQDEAATSSSQVIARLADSKNKPEEIQNHASGGIVITEMEEFVSKINLDEEIHKREAEDIVFKEEEEPKFLEPEKEDEVGGWTEVKDTGADEFPVDEEREDIVPDKIIHEPAVGKGLSGALQLLKERGTLKETVDWGGRNMDKKKSKLVGICDNDGPKEIRIERTDEFGRILTPKEAFRMISHKFHGKGPGKMKQEKKIKKYQEELKLKQMKASDTPSESMERMREAQARLKTPYLVLSGHVKPGQTSDPRSGFATVEKDLGSLTPMLGDRKVEHFLGIKRKSEPSSMGPPKKQKT